MSCCGKNSNGCSTRPVVELEIDFAQSSWCEKFFRMPLGTDGEVCAGVDGLTINSKQFTVTNNDPSKGLLDNFKFNAYYHAPVYTKKHYELILDSTVSAKQYFNATTPFPGDFSKRLRNIFADPRLAHAQISMIDPDNGIIAGWTITDQALFAMYGRLPISDYADMCNWTEAGARDCKPCEVACDTKYNCYNFWEDCRYIQFKTHSTYQDYCRFVNFMKWVDHCGGSGLSLTSMNDYTAFVGRYPVGDGLYESSWATWKAWNDWDEYQYFLKWYGWEAQERVWSAAGCGSVQGCSTVGACPGTCARKAQDKLEYKCHHTYNGCANCYATPVAAIKVAELYPYQFGAQRCCCDYKLATFLNLVEVQRREACDPLCDFANLGVGLDACASTLNWYINKRKVLTHVGVGRRMAEQYRVRENGGYAEDVYVRRVLIDFGTGSLLDASLPNNYNRTRAKDDVVDVTNLVPLQDNLSDPNARTNYYEIYNNKLGGLKPVNRADTFAVVSADPSYRLFKQGCIMKIRNIMVVNRRTFNDYKVLRIACKAPPCGSCDDKPGYCGNCDSDCEDEPLCADDDARNYMIEGLPGLNGYNASGFFSNSTGIAPIEQLQYALGNPGNPNGFGGGTRDITGAPNQGAIAPYILTRRPESKRYYEQKFPASTGVDPYNTM